MRDWSFNVFFLALTALTSKVAALQFHGICYTPYRVFGKCPTDEEVESDVRLLLKHTNRVRTYSTECKNVNRILLKHSSEDRLEILMGVWIDNRPTDQQEIDFLIDSLAEFPNARIVGVVVGNEVLYRKTLPKPQLLGRITEVRRKVRALGDSNGNESLKTAPVYAVETYPDPDVVRESDVVGLNIHPFYRPDLKDVMDPHIMSDRILTAAIQQIGLYHDMAPQKPLILTETGWPTHSSPHDLHIGSSDLALEYMGKFVDYCEKTGVDYYWFEMFDSVWKEGLYTGDLLTYSEFNFGIYEADRLTLKHTNLFVIFTYITQQKSGR